MPVGTFSVAAFHAANGVGSASSVNSARGAMFDLNVLTATEDQIRAQLEYLKQQSDAHGFPVHYLEFGNEFFIKSHYQIFFADAEEYVARIRAGLASARALFPGAKLGVPAGYRFCSNSAAAEPNELFHASSEAMLCMPTKLMRVGKALLPFGTASSAIPK